MPKFSAEANGPLASTFHFSAVDLSTLGASEYTLVGITVDVSGSVDSFAADEERALGAVVEACRKSPRADNLMLRLTCFNHALREQHGFKLLQDCNPNDYQNVLQPFGSTALFDAAVDATDALARYGKELQANDFSANGILFVITDGCDNASAMTSGEVAKSIERIKHTEALESIVTILIGVNAGSASRQLADFAKQAGFTQYVDLGDVSPQKLAKLADFVSRSISAQSGSLGTGGPSQPLSI